MNLEIKLQRANEEFALKAVQHIIYTFDLDDPLKLF